MKNLNDFMPLLNEEFDLTSIGGGNGSESTGLGFGKGQENEEKEITYSKEEIKSRNNIVVNISDNHPVVILFGAPTSGKTMILVRLTRYLESQGYKVEPYRLFRPAHDTHYQRICKDFRKLCYNQYAPGGNDEFNFMLVKVLDRKGEPICQILEAPGEDYFYSKDHERPFPTYIQQIITQIPNKRIWAFVVEKDWEDETGPNCRTFYSQRVQQITQTARDKAIFVCSQVDKFRALMSNNKPNTKQFKRDIMQDFPGIFNEWQNRNPFTRWFRKYNMKFVPFSAGAFVEADDRQTYIQGDDRYPRLLWKAIKKYARG